MMKMATGEGSPSGRVPEQGLDWFLVATEACGGGTPDLGLFLEVRGYIRGVGVENKSGGPTRQEGAPRVVDAPPFGERSISKKFLRSHKIYLGEHSNEWGECVHVPS